MTQALHLPQTDRSGSAGFVAAIQAIARAVANDHALALRAATKAASPRKNLAELRAMYVRPLDPRQETSLAARHVQRSPADPV